MSQEARMAFFRPIKSMNCGAMNTHARLHLRRYYDFIYKTVSLFIFWFGFDIKKNAGLVVENSTIYLI